MTPIDPAALAILESPAVGEAWLVDLYFSEGTYRLTNWPVSLERPTPEGQTATYTALGPQLAIGAIAASEDAGPAAVALSLPLAPGMLAATLGNVEAYRGRRARIRYQVMHPETLQPVGAPIALYVGEMQPVKVTRTSPSGVGGSVGGRVEMQLTRAGTSAARRRDGSRLTHAQQMQRHPGDMGLQYIAELVRGETPWLTVAFQQAIV